MFEKIRAVDPAYPSFEREIGEALRAGNPFRDMAGVAIYLASRAGAYLTGAVITVDGGISNCA